jgi:hypothetical protein
MEDDLYVVDRLDQYRSLCISTLARTTVADAGAAHMGARGYFIYEIDEGPQSAGIQVLAKAASLDAAFRLVDLWRERAKAPPAISARRF